MIEEEEEEEEEERQEEEEEEEQKERPADGELQCPRLVGRPTHAA